MNEKVYDTNFFFTVDGQQARSFTMEMLLKLHGLENELGNSALTRAIGYRLRKLGYHLTNHRYQGRWIKVWSNSSAGSEESDFNSVEARADRVMERLPDGLMSIGTKILV